MSCDVSKKRVFVRRVIKVAEITYGYPSVTEDIHVNGIVQGAGQSAGGLGGVEYTDSAQKCRKNEIFSVHCVRY
jgi:hypothetical protein